MQRCWLLKLFLRSTVGETKRDYNPVSHRQNPSTFEANKPDKPSKISPPNEQSSIGRKGGTSPPLKPLSKGAISCCQETQQSHVKHHTSSINVHFSAIPGQLKWRRPIWKGCIRLQENVIEFTFPIIISWYHHHHHHHHHHPHHHQQAAMDNYFLTVHVHCGMMWTDKSASLLGKDGQALFWQDKWAVCVSGHANKAKHTVSTVLTENTWMTCTTLNDFDYMILDA